MDIKKENGFTLIEVIISFAIITLILGVLININLAGFRFFDINQENIELSQALSIITANLDKKIRGYSFDNITTNNDILNLNDEYEYYLENKQIVEENKISGNKRFITDKIVNEFVVDTESGNLIYYKIILNNNDRDFEIENKIKPRI